MSSNSKYDSNDIEFLLLNKSFEELLPKEKTFILEQIDSKEEYEQMRATLLMIENNPDELIEPQAATYDYLSSLFDEKEKSGFIVWWNGIKEKFIIANKKWYLQPSFQVAMGVVVVAMIWWVIPNKIDSELRKPKALAENNPKVEKEKKEITPTIQGNNNLELEDIQIKESRFEENEIVEDQEKEENNMIPVPAKTMEVLDESEELLPATPVEGKTISKDEIPNLDNRSLSQESISAIKNEADSYLKSNDTKSAGATQNRDKISSGLSNNITQIQTDESFESYALSETVEKTAKKSKNITTTSISINDNPELLDLFYVAK